MLHAASARSRNVISVLSVSPVEEDHRALEQIISHTNWVLFKASSLPAAAAILRRNQVSAILCERDLHPGSWKDLLASGSTSQPAPPVIVTSRLADDELWGEVLNLGGHDVLAKPFELNEVVQVVSQAWWHWNHPCAAAAKPPLRIETPIVTHRVAAARPA